MSDTAPTPQEIADARSWAVDLVRILAVEFETYKLKHLRVLLAATDAGPSGTFIAQKAGHVDLVDVGRHEYPANVRRIYHDTEGRRCSAFIAEFNSTTEDNDARAQQVADLLNGAEAPRDASRPAGEEAK